MFNCIRIKVKNTKKTAVKIALKTTQHPFKVVALL
jgi:hypothetical protein